MGKYAQPVGINLSVMKPSLNLVQLSGEIACMSAKNRFVQVKKLEQRVIYKLCNLLNK